MQTNIKIKLILLIYEYYWYLYVTVMNSNFESITALIVDALCILDLTIIYGFFNFKFVSLEEPCF